MESSLKITEQPLDSSNGYQIIRFTGTFDKNGYNQIDGALETILRQFMDLDPDATKNLVFDFTDLDYINSQGIGILMEVHNKLAGTGKALVIVGLKQNVADVFQAIGMNELISIYPSIQSFLEGK